MQLPFVDVVVPHLDDRSRLAECLDLLHRQSYPADSYRVVVVDNGSQRPIDDLVARFPLARAAFEAEKGCGSARNRGVALTGGQVLAFTDSDCRPEPDWITNGVRRLSDGSGTDIVAGDIRVFAADESAPTDAELFDKVFGFEARRYAERKHFATGANILTLRRVFEAVGPFRNGELPEDLEWGRRAHRLGFRIGFAPDVVISHPARRSWDELVRKADRTIRHSRNYMAEQPLSELRWLAYTLALCSPPLVKCWQVMQAPQLADLGQRRRAMRTMIRLRYYRVAAMLAAIAEPARREA